MLKTQLKRFTEINEFFETTGFEKRTNLPDFFVFRFDELPKDYALKMPPYQKDFYQISLILNPGNAVAAINEQTNTQLGDTLYFLSPDHIFSWQRNTQTSGFVIYFKTVFLNFFSGNFSHEFSLFSLLQQNFLQLASKEASDLANEFERLYQAYYTANTYRVQILQASLLGLLFKCKNLQERMASSSNPLSKKQELVIQFQNLVANCYIRHKQVSEYAGELNVSANHLNQLVKEVLNKSAKEIISEKITQEAKRHLKYSTDDITEIAYALGFEEPTHFIRFFKKQTSLTPKAYRHSPV